ncbi:MAG: hypothetical protein KAI64_05510, partial [Thermoplasmata archaeon]|nr:hypothetical protein [Thermoplasmata archaeon]
LYNRSPARLRLMDIAAGTLIVKEAGGDVLNPADEKVLDMGFEPGLRTDVMVIGDREILEVLK